MTNGEPVDHHVDDRDAHVHSVWDNSLRAVCTVDSGDVVRFDCRDGNDGEITHGTTAADIPNVDDDPVHPLTGPVAVRGAEPGDVLEVTVHDVEHRGWGWTAFGFGEGGWGLLADEFDEPGVHIWDLDGDEAEFVRDITIPLDPFPGNLGTAPAAPGAHDTYPPRDVGGNLDVKHLTAGSTAFFPVAVPEALFSIGDGHAAQGDGEVCQTALEIPMSARVELRVRSDLDVEQPEFAASHPYTPTGRDEPMYATTGISDDLMAATEKAVSHMVAHLHEERGLTRAEAYMLCSVAVDLKVSEVVCAPNWTVTAYLPESIFPETDRSPGVTTPP
jgi:acetamidase/formamidase